MLLPAGDQFHVGIVVEDLEAARASLTEIGGYEWGADVQLEYTMLVPDGSVTYQQHLQYSVTEPRLELVQAVAGTPLQPSTSGLHHLGYWCEDVAATTAGLTDLGWRWECGGTLPDGAPAWAYCTNPVATRIELVSSALRDSLSTMWRKT